MKKRTYKRMQNRLYREIKRRMLLEHSLAFPPKVCVEQRKIETLAVRRNFPAQMVRECDGYEKQVKHEMAYAIAQKLCEDDYVVFFTHDDKYMKPVDRYELEARLDVVRPTIPQGCYEEVV